MADRFRLFSGVPALNFGTLGIRPDNTKAKSQTRKSPTTSILNVEDGDDIDPPSRDQIDRGFDFGGVEKTREGRDSRGPGLDISGNAKILFGDLFGLQDLIDPKPDEPPGLGQKKKQGTQALRAPGAIGFGGFV